MNGDPFGGAQVAAYLGAQSVLQRLNAVVPGRWRQEFTPIATPSGSRRLYMACRLIITLPVAADGPAVEAVYEDVGEMDGASRAGLKALYSDARKRAAVAAGIGAYLYTALEPVVPPIGPDDRQVQAIRRSGKPDLLTLSPGTEQWLRNGYLQRMNTEAVRAISARSSPTASPSGAWGRARPPSRQASLAGAGVLGRGAPRRPSASSRRTCSG